MLIFNDNGSLDRISGLITLHNIPNLFYDESIYDRFCGKVVNPPRSYNDTFNILNVYSKIDWADVSSTLPKSVATDGISLSFDELVDEALNDLLQEHEHLTLLWSGGYDSTVIATAFIKNQIDHTRFTILCTDECIKESPEFYAFMQRNKIDIHNIGIASLYEYLDNDQTKTHYILGLPEIQYGYSKSFERFKEFYFDPWNRGIFKAFEKYSVSYSKNERDLLISIFARFLYELGLHKVTNTIDLLFPWMVSNLYTQLTCHFTGELSIDSRFRLNNSLFYRTPDWMRWAFKHHMYHNESVYNEDYYHIARAPERDYILKIFNHPEIVNKPKVHSQVREQAKRPNHHYTIEHDSGALKIENVLSKDTLKNLLRKPVSINF